MFNPNSISSNYYSPTVREQEIQREVATMDKDVKRILDLIDNLSVKGQRELRTALARRRINRKDYNMIAIRVRNHLESFGSITAKHAYELGYSDRQIHSTTFKRCVIDKIPLDISSTRVKSEGRSVICFYIGTAPKVEEPFNKVDDRLVNDIINQINLEKNSHNLLPLLDKSRYPVLDRRGKLAKLHPLLVKAMAEHGYNLVSNKLDFERVE